MSYVCYVSDKVWIRHKTNYTNLIVDFGVLCKGPCNCSADDCGTKEYEMIWCAVCGKKSHSMDIETMRQKNNLYPDGYPKF